VFQERQEASSKEIISKDPASPTAITVTMVMGKCRDFYLEYRMEVWPNSFPNAANLAEKIAADLNSGACAMPILVCWCQTFVTLVGSGTVSAGVHPKKKSSKPRLAALGM
jgi:hypothetical protein